MAEDVRATLPSESRPELRLASGGSPAQGLEQLGKRERAGLIVLGTSERAGIGRIVPGSTARRLLSGSTLPVAIAPRGYSDEPGREPVIGVGFDGGLEAKQALDWASAMAEDVGGRLRLVAVHAPIAFANVSAGAFPTESVGQALRRRLRDEVDQAEASLTGASDVEIVFTDGNPATELTRASTDLDLLVLGSRAYGPVRSILLGSVSEATVAGSAAPIVVVPRGDVA
jgi:nucleotide-binding universal stress UspA family protein